MGKIYSIFSYPSYLIFGTSSVTNYNDAAFRAVISNDCRSLKQLIDSQKVNINSYNEDGFTLLHCAAEMGHDECVEILLSSKELNINQKDTTETPFGHFQTTSLHLAASEGRPDIVARLLEFGADINATNITGWTPLHYTIIIDEMTPERLESVAILLAFGADVNFRDNEGNSTIDTAILYGHTEVTRVLLNHGIRLNEVGPVDPNYLEHDGVFQCVKICLSGGCSRVIDKYDVINYIIKSNSASRHREQRLLTKIEYLLAMKSNVQSLKYLSRLKFRKHLDTVGRTVADSVNVLSLPDSLRWYLLLMGVEFT